MNNCIHIFLFLIINCCFSIAYSNPIKPNINVRYHLAISINPGANSSYVNYAIVGENSGNLVYTKFISLNEFIQIAKGKQFSPANQVGKNMFKDFNIKDCFYKIDSLECLKKPEPKIFDLWALRYNRNPFCPPDCSPADYMLVEGIGQHKRRPSWPQIQILQKYGIVYLNDFFYGDKLFELLSDFQKQEWRQQYQDAVE